LHYPQAQKKQMSQPSARYAAGNIAGSENGKSGRRIAKVW
jgi:hypothetical protein